MRLNICQRLPTLKPLGSLIDQMYQGGIPRARQVLGFIRIAVISIYYGSLLFTLRIDLPAPPTILIKIRTASNIRDEELVFSIFCQSGMQYLHPGCRAEARRRELPDARRISGD
jgi:hypothetical protein